MQRMLYSHFGGFRYRGYELVINVLYQSIMNITIQGSILYQFIYFLNAFACLLLLSRCIQKEGCSTISELSVQVSTRHVRDLRCTLSSF
ncbi:hypothetical protein GIB67_037312 [Kingdonia uniflora]|uniref:Uncharacterized protein n=1 Tax=Kingdonia uniflora TaxID=39325 RepID=A0A7J7MS19_9MAGN|nr:hypothetical protein GIB67_037312 [Kingdonia uniflora]